ncbi:hypothetical protein [Rhizobium sp. BK060]|uniref:hypothetical protein n=1 Tax=Rhizobium sp. BK060 TaxID=2587096 RepID=UPI00161E85CD|nr:hypothetical protein [Rhizobium sp. BK060]MBB3399714.1 hypothetical protein [Rhizobium sp. BK060]
MVLAPFAWATLCSCSAAAADIDPTTITVPYSSASNRTLGDAVSIAFPYNPLGRCVIYENDGVKWDTGGAISSEGKIAIASKSDEEKRTTDVALGFQTTGKIDAGIFNANSKYDTDITVDSFKQNASNTVTLEFSANADYGRLMIQEYKKNADAPVPATDLDTFRKRCGTHFIRGERRGSELTILIRIGTSSVQGKDALTARLSQTLGGGVSLKAITGEAGSTFTASYKSIIEYAKKAGNVSIEYHARGGPGIAAAGASAKLIDPADFSKLSEITANVSALFTQENSAITSYLLQANTALGAPDVMFDVARVEQIGTLTRKLMMLSEAADRYSELNGKYPDAYAKYFHAYGDKVNIARSQLVQLINTCAAGGSCAPPANDILATLKFLEDLFVTADVSLSCQYQPATSVLPVLNTPTTDPLILESVSINLLGTSQNPDLIDFSSTHVVRLTPDNEIVDETPRFSGFSLSQPDANNRRRAFGTVYSENIQPRAALRYDAAARKYIVDQSELQKRRDDILGSAFSVYAPGPNGIKASFDAGFPPRQGCPVMKAE